VIEGLSRFAEEQRLARLSLEGPMGVETLVARSDPSITMGGVVVTLPPAAFLQATADGEAALVAAVSDIVGPARTVADLFAGSGTFALPLSRSRHRARGGCCRAGHTGAGTGGEAFGPAVSAQHRDLFRKPLTAAELDTFDALVIDPPRAGAIAQTGEIAASRVPVVAAVSCNPATFARDAERLVAGGYALQRLWPVAQFRWSTHVELVAEFRREARLMREGRAHSEPAPLCLPRRYFWNSLAQPRGRRVFQWPRW
jgi:23S rRNA (uracil1939-C5)-methyltransferase